MIAHGIFSALLVVGGLRPMLSGLKYFWFYKCLNLISLETIRVGFPKEGQPPFISSEKDTGRLVGYYIDLARTLISLAGFNSTFIVGNNTGYSTLGNCLGNILFSDVKKQWLYKTYLAIILNISWPARKLIISSRTILMLWLLISQLLLRDWTSLTFQFP